MTIAAVIFDLDGTLADSLEDLANATNWGLTQLSQPTHPIADYRYMVGEGRNQLCLKALDDDHQHLGGKLAEMMTSYYADHCLDTTVLYPGIQEVLNKLKRQQFPMAILSNKPDRFVKFTVEKLTSGIDFAAVLGECETVPRKPDPGGALMVAEKLNLPPAEIAYVGDTWIDIETAKRAGMHAIGVTWGFRDREELEKAGANTIVDNAEQLICTLLGKVDRP